MGIVPRLFERLRSPSWDEVEYQALDLETSGLEPKQDRILGVGMVPLRDGVIRWGERYFSLVHPEGFDRLAGEAIAVHQILPAELDEAPTLTEVLTAVEERLEGRVLLAHHAPLDVGFLRVAYRATGRRWPRLRVVDTRLLLARLDRRLQRLHPYGRPLPRSLGEVRELLELPRYDYHHALTDALATAELFLALRQRLGLTTLRQLGARKS